MDISLKRKELIDWLQKVDDVNLLLQIEKVKQHGTKSKSKKLFSIEEARKLSLSKIEEWPKNQ